LVARRSPPLFAGPSTEVLPTSRCRQWIRTLVQNSRESDARTVRAFHLLGKAAISLALPLRPPLNRRTIVLGAEATLAACTRVVFTAFSQRAVPLPGGGQIAAPKIE
jgi:hypothetical protein